ncbi:aromatic ring-hydroxylating dioxygenase subunit alpha [Martelella alba]|uniref:Aromatic ring-hydroxylating dioxygenase subunit alpha n=1 Tax=Martelella alba TaxID=2590451 RepID=A0A506U9C5_9HYPH|nr:aromatic ring-hydroxylating dioxygenase subunit alpha [Martelella alba]TPW30480.1 aromatic ring-hydroxylating dioxygenase subunit alpha [Martelella alba]
MRVTERPELRRFWYCIMPVDDLKSGPKPFRLLAENIVLWLDGEGKPRAVKDRCLHRTAKLSAGYVEDGNIICPYHGWAFNGKGACVKVPQEVDHRPKPFGVPGYFCDERYGYVWVALEEPLHDIPHLPEFYDDRFRQVKEFREIWTCNPLRLVENSFDNSHIAFVHKGTFAEADPIPAENSFKDTEDGFICYNEVPVKNPKENREALLTTEEKTVRNNANQFFLPFSRAGRIFYPNGLTNIHCTFATPIDEGRTQRIQFVLRNDTDADVAPEKVIAFDRAVSDEDKFVIETTDDEVPLDASEGVEISMPSDRPGILMRKKLRLSFKAMQPEAAE